MVSSLNDIIIAIAPTISDQLITPSALAAIGTVAEQLPLTLGTTVGFECPLSQPTEADFFLRVSGAWGQSLLAGQPLTLPVLSQLHREPELMPPGFTDLWTQTPWHHIQQLARLWQSPQQALQSEIEDIWLEFDINQNNAELPVPSSFFGLKESRGNSLDWIGQQALPALLGRTLPTDTQHTLQQCLSTLSPTTPLFQVGALSGRVSQSDDVPGLRLYIKDMTLQRIRSMLQQLNWSGDLDLLTPLLSGVCHGAQSLSLQLEIHHELSPHIAVECYFGQKNDWQQVLNRLVTMGICSCDRAAALLAYPGYIRSQDNLAPFPALLQHWSDQLAPYRECLLVKRLAYLKFTYQPGQPLNAKAYLGVSPTWVDGRYLDPVFDNSHPELLHQPEDNTIQLCKALIQQLDYGEIDVDTIFPHQRSQKSHWLNKALTLMTVGG